MDLFNVETGKKTTFNNTDELHNAVLGGTHAFKKGSRVNVYDPADNSLKSVPAENVSEAIQAGFKVQTPWQREVDKYVEENDNLAGMVKVGAGQFADELLLSIPELIFDKTQSPLEVAKKEALKEHFSTTNAIAGVTGGLGSLVAGGPLFKGAAKAGEATTKYLAGKLATATGTSTANHTVKQAAAEIAKRMAAKAGGGAVEGAIVSAPRAVTEAALGDPDDAAETVMMGIGFGSLFGAGGELLDVFKKAGNKALEASGLREKIETAVKRDMSLKGIAEEKALEALNPNLGQRERLKALEEVVEDGADAVVATLKPTDNLRIIGRDLLDNDIIKAFDSKQSIYEKLATKTDTLRKEVGDILDSYDKKFGVEATIKTDELITNIRNKIAANDMFKTAAFRPYVAKIDEHLENLAASGPSLGLRQANREKAAFQAISKAAYNSVNAGIDVNTAQVLKEIPTEINRMIREKAGKLDPELRKELMEKQRLLGNLTQAENIAQKSAARESRNNDFGLNSFITGAGGLGAGAIIGGAPGAIAFGLAGFLGRELTRRYGDQVLAKSLDNVSGLIFAEQAMKNMAKKVDAIPGILDRMGDRAGKTLPPARTIGIESLLRLTHPKDDPKEKDVSVKNRAKALERLNEEVQIWASNPDATAEKLARLSFPLKEGGAPEIAGAFTVKMTEALNYIAKEIPKPPKPHSPYAPKLSWKPTDYDLAQFERKLAVVMDPFVVMDELERGSLTKTHMDALKAVYPKIHSHMVQKIYEHAQTAKKPLDYKQRLKLSLITGESIDQSADPKNLAYFQETFTQIDALLQNPQAEAGSPDLVNQMMTEQDAMVSRRG